MKKTRKIRSIRPTSSLVKNALFNILGSVEDLLFVDLFAGTGQVGLEAEQRGARVIYVEKSRSLAQKIRKRARGKVMVGDALRILDRIGEKADVIFADPPYSFESYPLLIEKALRALKAGGVFVLEHDKRIRFSPTEERVYGDTVLSFWRKEDE